jgi:DNA-binding NarL/FixJ family response regulator
MPRSILVVEDDTETREYFAEALRGDGSDEDSYHVMTAASLEQGKEELHRKWPDVLLVDLGLPDGSGLDLIRRARELSKDILILVITVFGDESSVVGAIEAGAHGYLLKSEAPADLRESVGQVLAGGAPISPGIASHLLRRFRHTEPTDESKGPRFTPREREVLTLMVKGLPYLEAAEILGVTRNTVAGHVKSIYAKLEVSSRGEAVYEALSQGIVTLESKD